MSWALHLYRFLSGVVEPVAGPILALGSGEGPDLRAERLGRDGAAAGPVDTWWHAASLGELGALEPLLETARSGGLAGEFVVTVSTRSGRRRARERWGERASLAPLDLPRGIARVVAARSPRALLLVETELWPNWIRSAHERGIPWAVVNGRLSERRWPRYRRLRGLWRPLLRTVGAVAARSAEDAERWIELGAPSDRVRVTGNLKVDRLAAAAPAELPWPGEDPIWTVGSLREGEERPVLTAFTSLRARHSTLRLVLALRHPERWGGLETQLSGLGLRVARRSRPDPADAEADVLLLDTQGELPAVYGASTLCLVGGTLVPVGGHNPLEAAVAGRPVLLGPYRANVREEADALLAAGGAVAVHDARELSDAVEAWLRDPVALREAERQARAAVASLQGATERTLAWLVERHVLSMRGKSDGP